MNVTLCFTKNHAIKLYLCSIKHHAMWTYWGMEVELHAFLTMAVDGGEWLASSIGRFTSGIRAIISPNVQQLD
jgi:hypothetical protein